MEMIKAHKQLKVSLVALISVVVITFIAAIIAVPISGGNIEGEGIPYPYLNTIGQFPRDYIWQISAIILMVIYLITWIQIDRLRNTIITNIGKSFAVLATMILVAIYYIHFNVVPISLANKEFEGIPLLIQYNSHGIFIVMEEIGYIFMFLSFISIALNNQNKVVKYSFLLSFTALVILFIKLSMQYGLDRKDRFEVILISVVWLLMIGYSVFLIKECNNEIKNYDDKKQIKKAEI